MINFNIFTSVESYSIARFDIIICTNFVIAFCSGCCPVRIINSIYHCIYSCHFTFICIIHFWSTIFISNISCIYADITIFIFCKTCAKFYIKFYSGYFVICSFYYSCCTFTIDKVYSIIRFYKIFCSSIVLQVPTCI